MKILLPDTLSLDPVLPADWQAVTVDARKPIPHEQDDAEALVLWGSTPDHILSASRNLHRLRFVQTLSAGADVVVDAGFNSDVILAAGSGLHDQTVAEHTMALLLSLVRELPIALHCQERHEWSPALGGVRDLHPPGKITTLLDTRTLILGFGRIGQTLGRILQQFGSSVTGVARSTGERAGFPVIALEAMMAELPEQTSSSVSCRERTKRKASSGHQCSARSRTEHCS
ncbi:NAD(P)-dependent oxidoreductase [Flexivirga alba]|uniref:NAD(P)-dependent oxidoreductase n=1 Tax=Flexivirga alba TaxID=702742 RepID=A0ABW2AJR7_9MICO